MSSVFPLASHEARKVLEVAFRDGPYESIDCDRSMDRGVFLLRCYLLDGTCEQIDLPLVRRLEDLAEWGKELARLPTYAKFHEDRRLEIHPVARMTLQAADPRSLFYEAKSALPRATPWAYATVFDRPFTPVPKPTRVSDPAWLAEVRLMPCCVCEKLGCGGLIRIHNGPVEPNHTDTVGSGGGDDSVAPMCHYHHQQWHLRGRDTMALQWGIDPRAVAAELWHWKETRAFG